MTPEHRAALSRLLARLEAGGITMSEASFYAPALRAVLAEPAAVEGGAWESAEAFARRHAGVGAVSITRNAFRTMTEDRDAQTADRLVPLRNNWNIDEVHKMIGAFIRDLRGYPR